MENNRRRSRAEGEPGGIITGAGSGGAVKEPVSALPLPPTWLRHGPRSGTRGPGTGSLLFRRVSDQPAVMGVK